jgi:O-antigen/teichoic acid export membrane protein
VIDAHKILKALDLVKVSNMPHKQTAVMVLRGIGALLRIATIYGLGFMLVLEEMSQFLFALTLLSTLPMLVTFEFHVASVREARRLELQGSDRIYKTALAANLIVSAVGTLTAIAPIFLLVGQSEFSLSTAQLSICIAIIFIDTAIQETLRVLAIKEEQITVSIVFFLKQLQVLVAASIAFTLNTQTGLEFITGFIVSYMVFTSIIAMSLYHARHHQLFSYQGPQFRAHDVATWLRGNARRSVTFFIAGVFGKLTFGYERLLVGFIFPKEVFTQYAFSMLIIGGIGAFIEPVVNQFVYPGLIRNFAEKDYKAVRRSLRGATVVLCLFSFLSITAILISQFALTLELLQLTLKQLVALSCLLVLLYANTLVQPFLIAGNLDGKIRNTNIIVCVIMYGVILSGNLVLDGLLAGMVVANLAGLSIRLYHISRRLKHSYPASS